MAGDSLAASGLGRSGKHFLSATNFQINAAIVAAVFVSCLSFNHKQRRDFQLPPPRLLPIALAPGTPVVSLDDQHTGQIIGMTQAYCIYDLGGRICVDSWHNVGISGLCPAPALLPATVEESDRLNVSARLLREFSALETLGELTPHQQVALDELLQSLCPALASNP